MRNLVLLMMAAMLLASAAGCNTCRSWFGKGSTCDPPECAPFGQPGMQAAPIYVPGPAG